MQEDRGQAKRDLLLGYWHEVSEHLVSTGDKFHDAALDYENDTVRVWYSEPMPSSLEPVVADALVGGVRIEFVRTRYD